MSHTAVGLVAWTELSRVAAQRERFDSALPEATWFQHTLAAIGYAVSDSGAFDAPTRRVIAAFQMKYRPSRYDGEPDAETAALMQLLAKPRGERLLTGAERTFDDVSNCCNAGTRSRVSDRWAGGQPSRPSSLTRSQCGAASGP